MSADDDINADRGIDDDLTRFSEDLRRLRREAGNPTIVALAQLTGVSKSVVSEAFVGRRLPSEKTVRLLVDALGDADEKWVARRSRLRAAMTTDTHPTETSEVQVAPRDQSSSPRFSLRVAIAIAFASAFLTSVGWWVGLTAASMSPSGIEDEPATPGSGFPTPSALIQLDAVPAGAAQ